MDYSHKNKFKGTSYFKDKWDWECSEEDFWGKCVASATQVAGSNLKHPDKFSQ